MLFLSCFLRMESLDEIALRHGTDKASNKNAFTHIYERLIEPLRNEPIRLLEIGVLRGASLRMWEDYLAEASIIGVDRNPTTADCASDRVQIVIAEQADDDAIRGIAEERGPFDVVIDDGSHIPAHQISTLAALWPALTRGGIYIIEDIHSSYFPRWDGGFRKPGSFIEYLKDRIDDLNSYWHQRPPLVPGLASMQLYPSLAILLKESSSFRGGVPLRPEQLAAMNEAIG
jgi:hypothetical protein